jgi:hypothetical protein
MSQPFCLIDSPVFDEIVSSLSDPHRTPRGLVPTRPQIVAAIDAALWASVRRDEGRELSFTLALADPSTCPSAMKFREAIPLSSDNISRLAPALVRGTSRLGISPAPDNAERLEIWGIGTVDQFPLSFEVRVASAARLAVGVGRFNIAVFRGNQAEWIPSGIANFVGLVANAFEKELDKRHRTVLAAVLVQVVAAMRYQGNGGTLLVVPGFRPVEWMPYLRLRYFAPFFGLREQFDRVLKETPQGLEGWDALPKVPDLHHFLIGENHKVSIEMTRMTRMVGSLTAVDGATVLDEFLGVVGFGAVIQTSAISTGALRVLSWPVGPIARREDPQEMDVSELGGTRHQSAARFVEAHHAAVAIVASHDGPLSVILWAEDRNRLLVVKGIDVLLD